MLKLESIKISLETIMKNASLLNTYSEEAALYKSNIQTLIALLEEEINQSTIPKADPVPPHIFGQPIIRPYDDVTTIRNASNSSETGYIPTTTEVQVQGYRDAVNLLLEAGSNAYANGQPSLQNELNELQTKTTILDVDQYRTSLLRD